MLGKYTIHWASGYFQKTQLLGQNFDQKPATLPTPEGPGRSDFSGQAKVS